MREAAWVGDFHRFNRAGHTFRRSKIIHSYNMLSELGGAPQNHTGGTTV